MSKLFIEDTSLTAIGDAIRGKTGGTELLSVPTGMVEAINGIQAGGSLKCVSIAESTDLSNYGVYHHAYDVTGLGITDESQCLIFFSNTTTSSNMFYTLYFYNGVENTVYAINDSSSFSGVDTIDDIGGKKVWAENGGTPAVKVNVNRYGGKDYIIMWNAYSGHDGVFGSGITVFYS